VRDVVASHDMIVRLFKRIHFFLQRLGRYTGVPLTDDFKELLGKIMAQILSILALSTKVMTERRISKLIHTQCSFLADYVSEQFLKRLIGRTNVEDAFLQLDSLTKEENLMAVARTLEVVHHVDDKVEVIDQNVKAVKERTQSPLSFLVRVLTLFLTFSQTGSDEFERLLLHRGTIIDVKADTTHRETIAGETSNMALSSRSFHQS
jgi:hypothetical protein